jgi:hypothetical protein
VHGLRPCHDVIWCGVGWAKFCHLDQLFDGAVLPGMQLRLAIIGMNMT